MHRRIAVLVSLTLAMPAFAFQRAATAPQAVSAPVAAPTPPAAPAPIAQKATTPAPAAVTPAPTAAASKPLPPLPEPTIAPAQAAPAAEAKSDELAPVTRSKKAVRVVRKKVEPKPAAPTLHVAVSDASRQYLNTIGRQLDDSLAK